MDRLTKYGNQTYHENGVCCTHFRSEECNLLGGECADGCKWEEMAWERLAAYEDTGMTPEQCENAKVIIEAAFSDDASKAERIRDLLKADKEGRLVVLPAKTVFEITWNAGPNCNLLCPVSFGGHHEDCRFCGSGKPFVYKRNCKQKHIDQIGKTVFLTREEAEKALEAMKGAEQDIPNEMKTRWVRELRPAMPGEEV